MDIAIRYTKKNDNYMNGYRIYGFGHIGFGDEYSEILLAVEPTRKAAEKWVKGYMKENQPVKAKKITGKRQFMGEVFPG